ncbi:A/G-specific adenine glycosylase [Evansella sp. AB-P1]|uniref:A/G-specific adenine glycosylase n=1 Tax=Evansella sp. AB-P1 TaxID=3037653 RepID=UPI00241F482F|nr:A/G-specific adenine glycosylase [Evansella sp. AB-P1]MDG5786241.1 A/G-specific adenine glycosylase [Evansella sp. AB-P1]
MSLDEIKAWNKSGFQQDLIEWYRENKRDLPWRKKKDPYKIWVSEIMLQQTKVDTVIPYFERFIEKFPTIEALADAEEETVLKAWEGLGYYSRARNLHQAVKEVKESYGGKVPDQPSDVQKLRGVGPYTAGAILSIAYDKPAPAVDGNVMRVLSRLLLIEDDISKVTTRKKFEKIVTEIISKEYPSDFNQAMMELGALICTPRKPSCLLCPVRTHCRAQHAGVQEQLPIKAKKAAPIVKKMQAVVLFDNQGKVLIEQRPSSGLLAKLWQFPNVEVISEGYEDIEKYLLNNGGLKVTVHPKQLFQVKHIFSHLVWDIEIFTGEMMEIQDKSLFDSSTFQLVKKDSLHKYPFPVSHQKIMKGVINN